MEAAKGQLLHQEKLLNDRIEAQAFYMRKSVGSDDVHILERSLVRLRGRIEVGRVLHLICLFLYLYTAPVCAFQEAKCSVSDTILVV